MSHISRHVTASRRGWVGLGRQLAESNRALHIRHRRRLGPLPLFCSAPTSSLATTTTPTSSTMTKAALIPASAPTSPLVHRNKQNHHPTTPQRPLHHSASARPYVSPFTPATSISTPYTPLSLRSFSSNGSSLATPASAIMNRRRNLSLSFTSPEMHTHAHNRSLADSAPNWRTRANENGIKVSPGDEPKFQCEHMRLVPPDPLCPLAICAPFPVVLTKHAFQSTIVAWQNSANPL